MVKEAETEDPGGSGAPGGRRCMSRQRPAPMSGPAWPDGQARGDRGATMPRMAI
jgi:hypothetical protein